MITTVERGEHDGAVELTELTAAVESISRRYAERFGIDRTDDWFLMKLQEELGELTQVHLQRRRLARTKGMTPDELDRAFASEVADVLGQLLLLAHHHGIDLEQAMREKWFRWLPRSVDPAPDPIADDGADHAGLGSTCTAPGT